MSLFDFFRKHKEPENKYGITSNPTPALFKTAPQEEFQAWLNTPLEFTFCPDSVFVYCVGAQREHERKPTECTIDIALDYTTDYAGSGSGYVVFLRGEVAGKLFRRPEKWQCAEWQQNWEKIEKMRPGFPTFPAALSLLDMSLVFGHVDNSQFPFRARIGSNFVDLRTNDFPDEPLFTIFLNGRPCFNLEDLPAGWKH